MEEKKRGEREEGMEERKILSKLTSNDSCFFQYLIE